jgi:hypothetical protein
MRTSTDELRQALADGGFNKRYVADLYYDGERRLQDVPVTQMVIDEDDSRAVKAAGTCTIVWQDVYGASIMPISTGDLFAPFGSELAVYAMVEAGPLLERVQLGWFQIVDVPTMRDRTMFFNGATITAGTTLDLKLQDRFIQIQRDEFDVPSSPSQLDSVYREIANLTGLQIVRSIPDAPINRTIAYQQDRMQAVLDLADVIGGIPYAASDGTLAMRPKLWPDPVDTMRRGDDGTIVDIGKGMTAEQVYNKAVFRGQGEAQDQVLAVSEILSGPLRVQNADGTRSPAHRRPTFLSNQLVTTEAQAKDYTDTTLAQKSTLNAVQWPITEAWNPLRELGDVLTIIDEHDQEVVARITALNRTTAATQKVTVSRG